MLQQCASVRLLRRNLDPWRELLTGYLFPCIPGYHNRDRAHVEPRGNGG
jgi:hypothetical protein